MTDLTTPAPPSADAVRGSQVDKSTGTKDPLYDLILVTQQALEDCFRYQHFADDAREAGDVELADLFDELAENDQELAERMKVILAARLPAAPGAKQSHE